MDVVVNLGNDPVEVAAAGRLLLASDDSVAADHGRAHLPVATAAWFAP